MSAFCGYGGGYHLPHPARMKPRRPHSFSYRAGIGLFATHITCDGLGFANDLAFFSSANAVDPQSAKVLTSSRVGRRQIVTTEKTLRLLGAIGDKLRPRTLPAVFGRPFNLGGHRIEIVPTGHWPGSAALLCEVAGRRIFYTGAFCPEPLFDGVEPAEVRSCDAICVDASLGEPTLFFPPRKQALADVVAFVQETLHDKLTPVLLGSPFEALPAVALHLARLGIALRGQARIAAAWSKMRAVWDALPQVGRFANKVGPGEVLLWPVGAEQVAALGSQPNLRMAVVSAAAARPEPLAALASAARFPLTNLPSFSEIMTAIEATGAREVALFRGRSEGLVEILRARGCDAYTLEPPTQMTLPRSFAENPI
jgi:hypothetical protein